jgi:hypothetical protein
MLLKRFIRLLIVILAIIIIYIGFILPSNHIVFAQNPTVVFPTVTSTASGPIVTVKMDTDQPQINLRAGPDIFYGKVGVLQAGQSAVAKGKSPGGNWILIDYPGIPGGMAWVWAAYVNITPGTLPVVEPPPTPTPVTTATIDPTLAAQFIVTVEVTRLPTFTAPPPMMIPTFQDVSPTSGQIGNIPIGMVIIGLAAGGVIVGLFALAQSR